MLLLQRSKFFVDCPLLCCWWYVSAWYTFETNQ